MIKKAICLDLLTKTDVWGPANGSIRSIQVYAFRDELSISMNDPSADTYIEMDLSKEQAIRLRDIMVEIVDKLEQ